MYRFIIISLVASWSLLSCEKDTVVRYETNLDAEFDIPTGLNTILTHYFTISKIPTFYSQSAANNNVDTSSIVNVLASRGLVQSKFQDVNFDFISRISVYAVSRLDNTIKREMYYLDFVPLNTNAQLKMLSSTTELKKILSEEFIDLEVRINVRSFVPANIRARIEFGYAVL